MDVESVRSVRSERSDRSKRSKIQNRQNDCDEAKSPLIAQQNGFPVSYNIDMLARTNGIDSPVRFVSNPQMVHQSPYGYTGVPFNFANNQQNWIANQPNFYAHQNHPSQWQQIPPQTSTIQNLAIPNGDQSIKPQSLPINPYRVERSTPLPVRDETAWFDNATAITGATSETGLSDNMSRFGSRFGFAASIASNNASIISGAALALIKNETDDISPITCCGTINFLFTGFLFLISFISPLTMFILPKHASTFSIIWEIQACETSCDYMIMVIIVKLTILVAGCWLIYSPKRPFFLSNNAILPKMIYLRFLFTLLLLLILVTFWVFYIARIFWHREENYKSIVEFSGNLVDVLCILFFTSLFVSRLRNTHKPYTIHVVRSPDGFSKSYRLSDMPIQNAALEILQSYMVDFPVFMPPPPSSSNPKRNGGKRGSNTKFKLYDVDGPNIGGNRSNGDDGPSVSASSRLYDESEFDKRTRKRRMRLLIAVEDAFRNVRRLQSPGPTPIRGLQPSDRMLLPIHNANNPNLNGSKTLDAYEAAQAVFPSLIRPLQKLIRVTRQQARHPVDAVIDHLAMCLAYGLSPQAFLERFALTSSTPQQDASTASHAVFMAKRALKQQKKRNVAIAKNGQDQNLSPPTPSLPKSMALGGQQKWFLLSERPLSQSLNDGLVFQLRRRCGDLSLLCVVHKMPLFQLLKDENMTHAYENTRFLLQTSENNTV